MTAPSWLAFAYQKSNGNTVHALGYLELYSEGYGKQAWLGAPQAMWWLLASQCGLCVRG